MRKFGTAQTANGTCSSVNTNDIPNNKNNNTKGGNAWVGEVFIINFEEGKNEVPISEKNRTSICNFPVNRKKNTHHPRIGIRNGSHREEPTPSKRETEVNV